MMWERPVMIGLAPTRRYYHSAVAIGPLIYVFGGFDGSPRTNDLHRLDTTSSKWSSVKVGRFLNRE